MYLSSQHQAGNRKTAIQNATVVTDINSRLWALLNGHIGFVPEMYFEQLYPKAHACEDKMRTYRFRLTEGFLVLIQKQLTCQTQAHLYGLCKRDFCSNVLH